VRVDATIRGEHYVMGQFVCMCVLFEVRHGKSANACSKSHTDDLLVDVLAGDRHRPIWVLVGTETLKIYYVSTIWNYLFLCIYDNIYILYIYYIYYIYIYPQDPQHIDTCADLHLGNSSESSEITSGHRSGGNGPSTTDLHFVWGFRLGISAPNHQGSMALVLCEAKQRAQLWRGWDFWSQSHGIGDGFIPFHHSPLGS
jgi:hypothetical protein